MDTIRIRSKKLDAERLIEKIVPSEERYIVENIKNSIKLGNRVTNIEIDLIDKDCKTIKATCSVSPLIKKEYREYMKYAKKFVDEYDKNKRYDV